MSDTIRCPKCGSTSLDVGKKGYSAIKGIGVGLLTGGIGLVAGFHGSKKVKITCLACGKKFKAGEGIVEKDTSNTPIQEQIEQPSNAIDQRIIELYNTKGLLHATKFCKTAKDISLADAKTYVEKLVK